MHEEPSVMGGVEIPQHLLRPFPEIEGFNPNDDLGRRILQLVALHPNLVRVAPADLAKMNDETKRLLISDMQEVLGIKKLAPGYSI